jgi:transposase
MSFISDNFTLKIIQGERTGGSPCTPDKTGDMKYMMSPKEMGRLSLIQGATDKIYTVREVARRLGLSERRVKQLKQEFRSRGEAAVIHSNAGKHPANYTDEDLRKRITGLKKSSAYRDANFAYFRELLEEREDIQVSYATVCRILKGAGIPSNRKHRGGGKRFKRRTRRSRLGELLQADATPFDWFGAGERPAYGYFVSDTGLLTMRPGKSSPCTCAKTSV